ncbi:aminodeoxychorismate synthase component I [Ideonella azotifigens]|uniref:Bifunctional anthranilate synthase component I family protein/class IV aminotransferase n=3 Tax=Ideonella azotifigens TaxID=513160 RepID=A0ABN1JZA4_9BURK|nr:aminodeoxychorismate synthase component I [Ideonella azotifigens]MCD2342708.1 aminodeoxychorismate synthase component I [Ideonella azotifigens]
MACFALLDDRAATNARPSSRLYEDFERAHVCAEPALLDATWAQVDADLRAGLHAVLLADYEWGAKLLKAGVRPGDDKPGEDRALRVLMFRTLTHLSREAVDAWLAEHDTSGADEPVGTMNLEASVDRAEFTRSIEAIHEAIRAGETYQVNYTYRMNGTAFGSPIALYRRLRARQPVDYGAFIALPAGWASTHVLSLSPELFLRHEAGLLTARPMKGTAARVAAPESDSESARLLALDIKNRAENLMIVDLLRNDLGRLAQTGSVHVPALFAIEPYATVFQMTSTVQAQIRPEVGMPELLRAVFPCGSITGAPKHHTMALIAGLESTPRGLYCGAIGWIDAPRGAPAGEARIGDFCLSVAIRTLTLGAAASGLRAMRIGVGAGIVLDSRADDEFDECRLKARFLTGLDPGFELFETMLWRPGEGVQHLERHLARLAHSARVFGFAFEREAVLQKLLAFEPEATGETRLRLALAHGGRISLTHAPLAPLPAGPVRLLLGGDTLPEADALAAHKTTRRQHYDAGVRTAESAGAFDTLFFSRAGRLVEGGRSNVFVRIDGRWWTPPITDGALPGVMRGVLLDDPAWNAQLRSLTRADLAQAERIVVCNALRGALPAELAVLPRHVSA